MSFWERSDSMLSDETLRSLKHIPLDETKLKRAIPSGHYGLREIGAGTFHRAYRSSCDFDLASVVRFNIHPSPNLQSLHLEQWVNNEALARGFQTPRIVHVDTSRQHCPYPFQVIEYADGVALRGQSDEVVTKALSQLGAALARLHEKPIPGDRWGRVGLESYPEWNLFWMTKMDSDAHDLVDLGLISDDQFDQIYAIGDTEVRYWGVDGARLLHGDLSYDNILLDAKTLDLKSVIDWEDAVLGDPIFELAGLATFHPETRHAAFIDAYYVGRAKPDDFEYRFWVYYLRIALAKAVHRHRFGYVTNVVTDHQNPDERISLALNHLKDL